MNQDLALKKEVVICVEDQLVYGTHSSNCLVPPNAALKALDLTIVETRLIENELVLSCTTPHPRDYQTNDYRLVSGKVALGQLNPPQQRLATLALQWSQWQRSILFCDACGGSLVADSEMMVKHCFSCGKTHYPLIKPAVITLVHDGPHILLARSPHHAKGLFSLIAGFTEMGESCEQAVHREVKEETGLIIHAPVYRYSQSWPFPDRLMLAFTAQYKGGELQKQEGELEALDWFSLDDLPTLPFSASVAYQLIQDYKLQWSKQNL